MLLVTNVRSLKEENEVSRTKGKRQPLREAKNAANTRFMVENALSESDDNSDSNTGEESNLSEEGTKTGNEPIKLGFQKYGCPFCSKITPHSGNMKQHILTHTGEKPFICDTCGVAFNNKSNLRKHNMIHTGERPFSCNFCDKSFTQKCDLQRHMKSMHPKM